MNASLKGRTVIVTGAGGQIGLAYCDALIEQGANLVMADLGDLSDKARQYCEQGGKAIAVQKNKINVRLRKNDCIWILVKKSRE